MTDQGLTDPKEKTILLVDDDKSLLDLVEIMVKREGFKVERAADGREAVQKIAAISPSLIVLDFMLPGMGGFEVLKELQTGDSRDIPVLVITGRKVDPQTREMIKQEPNVQDYLEKPIRQVQLITLLHKILGTRPAQAQRQDRGPLSGGW